MVTKFTDEFEELMYNIIKSHGLDDLSSRICALLYSEPDYIALEDISEKTGYSLSSISTAMKFLETIDIVHRKKIAGSRKVYFSISRNIMDRIKKGLKKNISVEIEPVKARVPKIIESMKKKKNLTDDEKKKLIIIEDYYSQTLKLENFIQKVLGMLENDR